MTTQKKVLLLLVGLTAVNLTIIIVMCICYNSSREYLNIVIASIARAAGYDVENNDWDEKVNRKTVENANQILAKEPNNAEALKQRANAYAKLSEYKSALADYDKLIMLEPTEVKWRKGKAKQHRELNQLTEAIAADTEVIKMEPSWQNTLARAEDYISNNQEQLAINDLEASTKLPQKDGDADYYEGNADSKRAELYKRLNQPEKMVYFISKFIDSQKDKATYRLSEAYQMRVEYWISKDNFDKALSDVESNIKDDTTDGTLNKQRKAALLLALNRRKEALDVYRDVLATKSTNKDSKEFPFATIDNANVSLQIFKFLHGSDDPGLPEFRRRCIEGVRKIVEKKPTSDEVEDYKIELKDVADFLELIPKTEGRSLALQTRKKADQLHADRSNDLQIRLSYYLDDMKAVANYAPKDPQKLDSHFYHNQADYALATGHLKEALAAAKHSLDLDPDQSCGQRCMTRVQLAEGNAVEAQKHLDRVKQINNKYSETSDTDYLQSQIYQIEGKKTEASTYLHRAVAANSDEAIARFLSPTQATAK